MSTDLRRRLERLEKRRTTSRAERRRAGRPLPPGEEVSTPNGVAYRIDTAYEASHLHGRIPLQHLLSYTSELAAEVAGDVALSGSQAERWAFIDLETTGLAGGAGTLGFLVGVGTFEGGDFRLRQYFLRDPGEEPAMLEALRDQLEGATGFVSFNGRSFDIPLLDTRYVMALREQLKLTQRPHLDLLYPSRRLWSRELANCRLTTLEREVLRIERSEQDVPGAEIPGMYLDYLRTGDAADMERVIYHNALDILSLVGLASEIMERHQARDPAQLSGSEALAVARWHQAAGRDRQAEAAYQVAVEAADIESLRRYGRFLKRRDRRVEALPVWEAWHRLDPGDPVPCIELAMYYEWHARDPAAARDWTQEAGQAVERWPDDWRKEHAQAQVQHRLNRLHRKLRAERQRSPKSRVG